MKLIDWFALRNVSPELAIAQFAELKKQIPVLYAMLAVNASALAFTHITLAPSWMAIWLPAFLVIVSISRMIKWLALRGREVDASSALRHLRRTNLLASIFAAAYICWALGLSKFGGDHEQAHVAIFIGITVIGCIFCLTSLPQAALSITAIVMLPSLYYFVSMGDAVYAAIGINISLVTVVIVRVVFNNYRELVAAVFSRLEMERLHREVTILAHTDALTQLPNRRLFFSELSGSSLLREKGLDLSLGIIDLDRFKAVNDSMGHLFGDQLLEAVALRLKNAFPEQGMVARLGGDEFAFLIHSPGLEAAELANTLCEALSQPYSISGVNVSIGATSGVAAKSTVGNGASLYDAADYALYKGKADRRGFATLYAAKHEELIRAERTVEAALQTADLQSELNMHFQPILNAANQVVAVEALARWTSPVVGAVRPDIFIPLAERAGIIHRLTLTLFEKSVRVAEELPPDVKMSFNLSAHDLSNAETVLGLIALIRRSTIPSSQLIFELTETAVMRDFEAAEQSIVLLRALGVEIALDDFGTGQSSLSYLRRLQVDKVKIDRSFVMDAQENTAGYDLLAAIVALCGKMKIHCVAEGVETEQQFDALMDLGCDSFQGYHFSKPMPASDLFSWLSNHSQEVHSAFVRGREGSKRSDFTRPV